MSFRLAAKHEALDTEVLPVYQRDVCTPYLISYRQAFLTEKASDELAEERTWLRETAGGGLNEAVIGDVERREKPPDFLF